MKTFPTTPAQAEMMAARGRSSMKPDSEKLFDALKELALSSSGGGTFAFARGEPSTLKKFNFNGFMVEYTVGTRTGVEGIKITLVDEDKQSVYMNLTRHPSDDNWLTK